MKFKALVMVVLLACAEAAASDFSQLLFRKADGSETLLQAEGLRMSVADGNLIVDHTGGNTVFRIQELYSMQFANQLTESVGIIEAKPGDAIVYSATGLCIGTYSSADEARRAIKVPGLYVIRTNSRTQTMLISR